MKKTVIIAIMLALLVSMFGCGANPAQKTNDAEKETVVSVPDETADPRDPETESEDAAEEIEEISEYQEAAEEPKDRGLLGAYVGDVDYDEMRYARVILAWIEPESGSTTVWREFSAKDPGVILDPRGVIINDRIYGKEYLRQLFDASYERIVARNSLDNSWGWVDTEGNYTNVTGTIDTPGDMYRHLTGAGFFGACYYMSSESYPRELEDKLIEYWKKWESSRSTDYLLKYNEVQGQVEASVQFEMLKVPVDSLDAEHVKSVDIYLADRINEPDFSDFGFLIQKDSSHEMAYVYTSGNYELACPVFYDELNGACVTKDRYSDWLSPERSIFSSPYGEIGIFRSLILGDRLLFDTSVDLDSRLLYQFEDPEILIDEREEGEEYYGPILNPEKDSFACLPHHVSKEGNSKRWWIGSPVVFSITGEKVSTLDDAGFVSVSEGSAQLQKLLDWTE